MNQEVCYFIAAHPIPFIYIMFSLCVSDGNHSMLLEQHLSL